MTLSKAVDALEKGVRTVEDSSVAVETSERAPHSPLTRNSKRYAAGIVLAGIAVLSVGFQKKGLAFSVFESNESSTDGTTSRGLQFFGSYAGFGAPTDSTESETGSSGLQGFGFFENPPEGGGSSGLGFFGLSENTGSNTGSGNGFADLLNIFGNSNTNQGGSSGPNGQFGGFGSQGGVFGNIGSGTEEEPLDTSRFVDIMGIFNIRFRLFGKDIVGQEKTSPASLEEDLANVARFMLNNVVKRNTNVKGFENAGVGRRNPNSNIGRPVVGGGVYLDTPTLANAVAGAASGAGGYAQAAPAEPSRPEVGDTIDDFGTNNQEDNIEEGDVLVSNGDRVFAAYGDYIVVWDARQDEVLAQVRMPPIPNNGGPYGYYGPYGPYYGGPVPLPILIDGGNRRRTSSIAGPGFYEPYIRSLALHEGKLLVIVEGYGRSRILDRTSTSRLPILYDYQSTNVRVYDTNVISNTEGSPGTLPFRGATDLNGRFSAVRIIDGNAHIVTTTGIDTFTDLVAPFKRSNFDEKLTDEEYIAEVKVLAEGTYIKQWTDALADELRLKDGTLPNLARVSLFQTEASSDSDVELLLSGEGLVNTLAQVFSIDLENESNFSDTEELTGISASGSFLASYFADVYAAQKTLIIAGKGWNFDNASQISRQATYLIGLAINDDSTVPTSVGTVEGHVLNSFSIDVVGNTLRIATFLRNNRRVRPAVTVEGEEATGATVFEEESSTLNFIRTVEMPGLNGDEAGTMVERGSVRLGKPDELFTAVRFFDTVGYAATFLQRDPFYVVDLSDIDKPVALGELDINGFSTYLESMNDDDTLLLAIGQDADDDGRALGLKLTVFDARNPAQPTELQQFSFADQNPGLFSNSVAQWNFKAIRYVRDIERLIIPVNIYNRNVPGASFDGFVVFVVNEQGIEEDCRIAERDPNETKEDVCYYCAFLPSRSLLFDGNLMTVRNSFIQRTDLDTCDTFGRLRVQIEAEGNGGCCN